MSPVLVGLIVFAVTMLAFEAGAVIGYFGGRRDERDFGAHSSRGNR